GGAHASRTACERNWPAACGMRRVKSTVPTRVTRETQGGSRVVVVLTTPLVNVPVPSSTTGGPAHAWRPAPATSMIEVTTVISAARAYPALVVSMVSSPLHREVGLLVSDGCCRSKVIHVLSPPLTSLPDLRQRIGNMKRPQR